MRTTSVIASQRDIDGLVDIALSEAIQFFVEEWIASSHPFLGDEERRFSQ